MYGVAPSCFLRVVSPLTMSDNVKTNERQRGAASESSSVLQRLRGASRTWAGAVVGSLVVSAVSFACDRGEDARAESAAPEVVSVEAKAAETKAVAPAPGADQPGAPADNAAPAAGQATYKEEGFELGLEAAGPFAVGKAGEAQVVLVAKNGFKVNDQYPFKLTLSDAAGLELPRKVVTRDAMALEKHKGVMKVAFTPKSAGAHTLSGRFSFSVCTDERCLIEKRDLAVQITAQ